MKTRNLNLCATVLMVCCAAACAQGPGGAAPPPALGFKEVIFGGGLMNTVIWLALFALQLLVILSAIAVISGQAENGHLVFQTVLAVLLGIGGTVVGMVQTFASLANEAGAAKAQLLALAISSALWTTTFGLFIAAQYGLLLFLSGRTRMRDD
jgi:hypothetical protein